METGACCGIGNADASCGNGSGAGKGLDSVFGNDCGTAPGKRDSGRAATGGAELAAMSRSAPLGFFRLGYLPESAGGMPLAERDRLLAGSARSARFTRIPQYGPHRFAESFSILQTVEKPADWNLLCQARCQVGTTVWRTAIPTSCSGQEARFPVILRLYVGIQNTDGLLGNRAIHRK